MLKKLREASVSVQEYFFLAAITWFVLDDDAARLAAIAAGSVVKPGRERQWMLLNLTVLTSLIDDAKLSKVPPLVASVQATHGSISAKRELAKIDPGYRKAVCNWYGRADADIFVRRHPELVGIRKVVAQFVAGALYDDPLKPRRPE
jgi:hypothetical protein